MFSNSSARGFGMSKLPRGCRFRAARLITTSPPCSESSTRPPGPKPRHERWISGSSQDRQPPAPTWAVPRKIRPSHSNSMVSPGAARRSYVLEVVSATLRRRAHLPHGSRHTRDRRGSSHVHEGRREERRTWRHLGAFLRERRPEAELLHLRRTHARSDSKGRGTQWTAGRSDHAGNDAGSLFPPLEGVEDERLAHRDHLNRADAIGGRASCRECCRSRLRDLPRRPR